PDRATTRPKCPDEWPAGRGANPAGRSAARRYNGLSRPTPVPAMTASPYRKPLPGTTLDWVDAREAVDALRPGAWARLPYTARVHAENIVRRADPARVDDYLLQLVERRRDLDFPWFPARVVCHDILGQTALVDLAGL